MLRNKAMLADAHISSLGYLWRNTFHPYPFLWVFQCLLDDLNAYLTNLG